MQSLLNIPILALRYNLLRLLEGFQMNSCKLVYLKLNFCHLSFILFKYIMFVVFGELLYTSRLFIYKIKANNNHITFSIRYPK